MSTVADLAAEPLVEAARPRSWAREHAPAAAVFVGAIAAWELLVHLANIPFFLLPAPHVIAQSFARNYPLLLEAALYTFREALVGYGLGCTLGVAGALVASRWPAAARVILPYAVASNAVPIIALAPLAIVWFGVEEGSKIAIVTLMTFFPTFISTARGLLAVSPASLELMHSYGAREGQVFLRLRLPTALPYMFTAFKLGTTLSMIGAVVSEFFGGTFKSLGVYIKSEASLFHTREAWSAIIVACALGIAFYLTVALVERLVIPWHVSFRKAA